jgi:hypothetical protein
MIWIMFGVGAALGVGIGVAIGGCVAALIIGWWDRDADRTVRREGFLMITIFGILIAFTVGAAAGCAAAAIALADWEHKPQS